ncbi:MAG: GNAT family N-acetyltransferase [Proteobacteria bacterium]|nr:GNAT family N-acetyltransferase [Pseudomonadota bacterium]
MKNALQFCRERRFKSILLWTFSALDAAARLYQSVGFRKTEQKTHQLWGRTLTEERYDLFL